MERKSINFEVITEGIPNEDKYVPSIMRFLKNATVKEVKEIPPMLLGDYNALFTFYFTSSTTPLIELQPTQIAFLESILSNVNDPIPSNAFDEIIDQLLTKLYFKAFLPNINRIGNASRSPVNSRFENESIHSTNASRSESIDPSKSGTIISTQSSNMTVKKVGDEHGKSAFVKVLNDTKLYARFKTVASDDHCLENIIFLEQYLAMEQERVKYLIIFCYG